MKYDIFIIKVGYYEENKKNIRNILTNTIIDRL